MPGGRTQGHLGGPLFFLCPYEQFTELLSYLFIFFILVLPFSFSFPVGFNQFSDMTFAEVKRKYLWSEPQVGTVTPSEPRHSDL